MQNTYALLSNYILLNFNTVIKIVTLANKGWLGLVALRFTRSNKLKII